MSHFMYVLIKRLETSSKFSINLFRLLLLLDSPIALFYIFKFMLFHFRRGKFVMAVEFNIDP